MNNGMKMIMATILVATVIAGALFMSGCVGPTEEEQVTVMMPYIPTVGWTPFYCAIDQGYYADEGLDVTMEYSPTGSVAPIQQVGAGKIEFGYADMNTLVMSRSQEVAVVAVYQGEQTNVFNVIAKKDSGITQPQDLDGKVMAVVAIGAPPHLMAKVMLLKSGVDYNNVTFVPLGSGGEIPALLGGKADAMAGHMVSTFILKGMGRLEDVNVMWMKDYGANLPPNAIIVNEKMLEDDPELIRKFVRATDKGLRYGVDNPEEAVDTFIKSNPEAAEKREFHLAYWKAFVDGSIQPDKYTPGRFDYERLVMTQDALYDIGVIEKKINISKAYTKEFLPYAS
jgi:ABC-type nitrate/sulfonate/bicarbonate transport system substrate-binding protein